MGYAQLSLQDKIQAFALLAEGWSVICVAAELKVTSREPPSWCSTSQKIRLWGTEDDVSVHRQGSGKRSEGRPFDYSRQPERETPQPPVQCLGVNSSTSLSGLKIASTPRCQEAMMK
ncbi:hypothetical protein E2C01_010553 [Portunus trituberculatus]|uniref:Uncharacterized protein n=1 Tax=Portunus trituberculatus TaxID=210409 RepID=A0A5B7D8R6_PORTR|nr:hypothetical protein [Portunus trituberculatus]